MLKISNATVVDEGLHRTNLYVNDGKIEKITEENLPFDKEIDAEGLFVSADFAQRDALSLSHLKELYYRCLSHQGERK